MFSIFFEIFEVKGLIFIIGFLVFIFSFKYSRMIFDWLDDQTFGTRQYILDKMDLLMWTVEPKYITYLLLTLSLGAGIFILSLMTILGNLLLGIVAGSISLFIGTKIPRPLINYLVTLRHEKYKLQMTDALQLMANGLRAGLSVPQAIGIVVDELPAPISEEFNVILQQNKIGVPLEECFEGLVKRVPLLDNNMFVTSVNILRETGGNLAEVFETICDVIRERVRVQQKIDSYIAQGLIQGATIFCIPTFILIGYGLQNPELIGKVFSSPVGIVMLTIGYALNFTGGFFILKIVRIKV